MMSLLSFPLLILVVLIILLILSPLSTNQRVRYYGCSVAFVFLVSCVAVISLPFFLWRPKSVKNAVIAGAVLKHMAKLFGIQWQLRGGDVLAVERGAVIVANHQTMFDVLGMYNIWEVIGHCAPVAKKEIFYVWPFGLLAWVTGTVFIDRSQSRKANQQLDEASTLLRYQKTKIWLFPEGTRNNKRDTLLPFKKGAFRVAIDCQVPIIPVVFSPYYFLNSEKATLGHGHVIVQALDPISTQGMTEKDINPLMETTRNEMVKQYQLLGQEVLRDFRNTRS